MNKKNKKNPRNAGRKKLNLCWDDIERAAMSGANGRQIAEMLGVCYDSLSRKCLDEKKMNFSEYLRLKRQKGDGFLLMKQYDLAYNKGDRGMLIWLGKNRLGQTDKKESNRTQEIEKIQIQIIKDKKELKDDADN